MARAKRSDTKKASVRARETKDKRSRRLRPVVALIVLGIAIIAVGGLIGYGYVMGSAGTVYSEDATVHAPLIAVIPASPGPLDRVFVAQEDPVRKGMIIASVGGVPVRSPATGRVVSVVDSKGSLIGPTNPLAQLIDPEKMRVVARIKENKGLSRVKVGDPVSFTVDAFGSQRFNGTVTRIAQTASSTSQVFSISNTRPTQTYDVEIGFDGYSHPELKSGMSAKVWIRT